MSNGLLFVGFILIVGMMFTSAVIYKSAELASYHREVPEFTCADFPDQNCLTHKDAENLSLSKEGDNK